MKLRSMLVLAAGIAMLTSTSHKSLASAARHHQVVSYLVSADSDSNDWSPLEAGPIDVLPPHRWEWRIYDPLIGRDSLFRSLPSFPWGIRWDSAYAAVEFIVGNRIARTPWAYGGRVETVAPLPSDSSLCDFWQDQAGGWHVVTQREIARKLPDGRSFEAYVGTRWDRSRVDGTWQVAAVDSQAGGHYGECYVTPELERGAPRPRAIKVDRLLAAMSLDPRPVTMLPKDSLATEEAEDWVWVPMGADTTVGLEMGAAQGDSYHGMEPVVWVDRKHDLRRIVYPVGSSMNQSLSQVGFKEWNGLVLITSEYEGGYPSVIALRSGETMFKVDRSSARAVWVPAPR